MPANDPLFAISRFPGEFIDEVQVKDKIDVAERKNRVGVTKRVHPHNAMTDVSIKGGGIPPLALGVIAQHGVAGLASGGVFLVKERTHTQKNEGFDDFDLNASHWPEAEVGAPASQGV